MIDIWPWQLTELTARTVTAFVSLPAVAWWPWRSTVGGVQRLMVATIAVGLVMLLVGVWRTWSDFDQGNWVSYVYVGGLAVTLGFLIGMLGVAGTLGRTPGRRHRSRGTDSIGRGVLRLMVVSEPGWARRVARLRPP